MGFFGKKKKNKNKNKNKSTVDEELGGGTQKSSEIREQNATKRVGSNHRPSSLYHFAIQEYSNTVGPQQSNDDGSMVPSYTGSLLRCTSLLDKEKAYIPPRIEDPQSTSYNRPTLSMTEKPLYTEQKKPTRQNTTPPSPPVPATLPSAAGIILPMKPPVRVSFDDEDSSQRRSRRNSEPLNFSMRNLEPEIATSHSNDEWSTTPHFAPDKYSTVVDNNKAMVTQKQGVGILRVSSSAVRGSSSSTLDDVSHTSLQPSVQPSTITPSSTFSSPRKASLSNRSAEHNNHNNHNNNNNNNNTTNQTILRNRQNGISTILQEQMTKPPSSPEPEMPDTTYEENYGDAYVSKPIRYIYPSGYGNMRPRSYPWRISVLICGSFTWLTVFIVGHCSDDAELDNYYARDDENIMTDEEVIATRWCGSRALYFMWVLSVLITGMACAYCSIIGYIKARDFAVANGRSQPPGLVGKSDFYVRIDETVDINSYGPWVQHQIDKEADGRPGSSESNGYGKSIYQADGTPRFLGGRIYRPTQAAVHLTSR